MSVNQSVADVQSSPDPRNIPVNRVGVRRLRHPICFEDFEQEGQNVIGKFDMLVDLPKNVKGTHMSRFIEMLNEAPVNLSLQKMPYWLDSMVTRLGASEGFIKINFPYFINKQAPVTKVSGLLDYDVTITAKLEKERSHTIVEVNIPVTSLCPCSKEISEYGAHNQRSNVSVTVNTNGNLSLKKLIQLVESKASCELYSILKRPDEKLVTERAYDNPKFVEDMVRDIAAALEDLENIDGYKISSENFESIHNHSAFAEINKL